MNNMGTNFYHYDIETVVCRHIGKSSVGWVFLLRVHADEGIHTLEDWQKQWQQPNTYIEDEYGKRHSPADMLRWITERAFPTVPARQDLLANTCEVGPANLMRPHISGWAGCSGHGEGTWSYVTVPFT